ncbi:MAG: PD-(D/E)XK nuclease family protein, partial [Eubacterium sp.]
MGRNFFKGKKVFIDGFNGFVAQEYKLLELVISEADSVTLTLCTDLKDTDDEFNLFAYVNNSAKILEKIAKKANTECCVIKLEKNYRAKNAEIEAIEKHLFSSLPKEAVLSTQNCRIYAAKNISDECANTSREIKKLLRNGYKASEIAVITRDIDKYRDELSYNLKKYGVSYFNDERQPIANQPLIVLIKYLLRCVNYSFKSDDILSLAKTGLTEISDADINTLENYVYLWNINGMKWTKPFTNSTKGFAKEITKQDEQLLEKINSTRSSLIEPILIFKNAAREKNAEKICKSIYYTILSLGADKMLRQNAVSLSENGFYTLAQEQGRVWDLVMEILNQMAVTITHEISLKEFERLFSLIVDTEDLGTASVGIDNVQFGQADRIRTDNPKAVFILGADEGEFPQTVTGGGLLTENERRIMLDNDFKLYSYGKILNLQERYFAYTACTCSSERLYVSYTGNTGKEPSPSEIITDLKGIVSNICEYTYYDIDKLDLIETQTTAFELMSEHFTDNDTFYASLKEYFKDNERFNAVKSLAQNESTEIKSREISTKLFDYNMYVSASRLEDFYNCPFRYFCKFGLSAKPRERAEINPMQRGTIIHYVLERLISDTSSKKLSDMPKEQLISLVDKYMLEYFENEMASFTDADKKFMYNYNRLAKLIYSVVFHLSEEFSQSDFEADAFELSIDKDGEVKPEIIPLDDGGTIQIRGSIDRVDTYTRDNQKYVRVVDYKSGSKSFNLSDIMFGLNLQMFVYLFSL